MHHSFEGNRKNGSSCKRDHVFVELKEEPLEDVSSESKLKVNFPF